MAQDPTLAARLHYTLAFDRLNMDPDDHEYVVANAMALVVGEMYLIVRNLNDTGDIEAARQALDRVVKNWAIWWPGLLELSRERARLVTIRALHERAL